MGDKKNWHVDRDGGELNKWLHSGPVIFNTPIPAAAIALGILNVLSFLARKKIERELASTRARIEAVKFRLANIRVLNGKRNPDPVLPDESDEPLPELPVVRGKVVNGAVFIHVSALKYRRDLFEIAVLAESAISEKYGSISYNVVKVWPRRGTVKLLDYPRFFEDGVPRLFESWVYNVETGRVSRHSEFDPDGDSAVLHRKELLLNPNHRFYKRSAKLSHKLHGARLLSKSRIGKSAEWGRVLDRAGYRIVGYNLVCSSTPEDADRELKIASGRELASAPLRWALDKGLVEGPAVDWGCGRGADVAEMRAKGIRAVGYDPVWAPILPRGYVYSYGQAVYLLNVIEAPRKRVAALSDMLRRVRPGGTGLVAVRSRRAVQDSAKRGKWAVEGDGWRTSAGTFQHGFIQDELESMLKGRLDISKIFKRYGSIIAVGTRKRIK